jgi:hypothetical protein
MFNNLNGAAPADHGVDDIFAETEGSNQTAAKQPNAQPEAVSGGLSSIADSAEGGKHNQGTGGKKIRTIIFVVIVVAVVALTVYLAYMKLFAGQKDNSSTNQTPASSINTKTNVPPVIEEGDSVIASSSVEVVASTTSLIEEQVPVIGGEEATSSPEIVTNLDSDMDALTDAEEAILGTNKDAIDTDGDGLSDYEEVKVYNSNPLLLDTDGDGYSDLQEVKNGYNPNGGGKLGM